MRVAVAAWIVALLVAACGSPGKRTEVLAPVKASSGPVIRVGVIAPFRGGDAATGTAFLRGARLAAQQHRGGARIEFEAIDLGGVKPAGAGMAAPAYDWALAIGPRVAVSRALQRVRAANVVVASADVEPVGEWTSVAQSEHVVASACVHVATRYGPVAVLSADGAKWTAMHESVTEKLRGLQRGTMEVRVPSLRAIHNAVDEIRRSGARAVIVLADPTSTVVVASEFRQAQVEIVLVGGPWLAGFSWKDPNILEGLTYVAPYFPNSPTWERFARAFNDAYREPADLAAARGFDAATLLGAALSNEAERGILPEEARLVAGYLLRGTNVGLDVVRIQGGESALVGRMIVRD